MADGQSSIDPSKLSVINILVHQLGLLMTGLLTASRATGDGTKLAQIANEMTAVQTVMAQASQMQAMSDNTQFSQATVTLKAQGSVFQGMATQITNVIADVTLAGQIVGYVTQAITLIAQL